MTAAEIAEPLAMPVSTVSVVLKRNGVGKLGRVGLEQPVRYVRARHSDRRPACAGQALSAFVSYLRRWSGIAARVEPARWLYC